MRIRLGVERLEARDLPAVPFQQLPVLPFHDLAVLDHARAVFACGQHLGRRTDVLLKIGDSNSSSFFGSNYLTPLGGAAYDPFASGLSALYPGLFDTWAAYRFHADSLTHEGPAASMGWRSDNVLRAIGNEIRVTNAAIALVMIGTNDAMVFGDAALFRGQLTRIVTTLLRAGVLPVLSTIPDSHFKYGKYEPTLMAFNQVIANVADRYAVPLWNVWRSLHALPNHGLQVDGVHLDASPNGGGSFWSADLQFGQNVRTLQGLQILDWLHDTVSSGIVYVPPTSGWQPLESTRRLYAVSRDAGFSPTVDVYDAGSGELVNRFLAFGASFGGGVRVATGDTNGDSFTDVVCVAAGSGLVKVISGADGTVLARYRPFGRRGVGGLTVAVGDLNGDGSADIVFERGGAVRVYEGGTDTVLAAFRAVRRSAAQGVSVAVANVEAVGPVVVVAGGRFNAMVRYFDSSGTLISSFRSYKSPGHGVTVTAADLNGDGCDEVIVGRGGSEQRLRVFDGATFALLAEFVLGPAINPTFGIRLGAIRSTGADTDTLLVASAPGSPVSVLAFDGFARPPELLPLDRANRAYGIFVG